MSTNGLPLASLRHRWFSKMPRPARHGDARFLYDEAVGNRSIRDLPASPFMVGCTTDDLEWTVLFGDPGRVRRFPVKMRFDTPIAPGPVTLDHPDHAHDLLTIRTITRLSFDPILGIVSSEDSLRSVFNCLVDLVRWRETLGIRRFCDLNPIWFTEYVENLGKNGIVGLLKLEERARDLVHRIDRGDVKVPLSADGRRVAADSLARMFGFAWRLQVPHHIWRLVIEAAERQHPRLKRLTAKGSLEAAPVAPAFENVPTHLQSWDLMWLYRDWLAHDRLQFEPIRFPDTVESIANSIKPRIKATRGLPPAYETCLLITEALRCSLEWKPSILSFYRQVMERVPALRGQNKAAYESRRRALVKILDEQDPAGPIVRYMNLEGDYRDASSGALMERARRFFRLLVPGAAAISVSAFLARRPTETASIRVGDWNVDRSGRGTVSTWTSKTSFDDSVIPAPASVIATFELLQGLKEAGSATSGSWVFDIGDPVRGGSFSVRALTPPVQEFAAFCGATNSETQGPIQWSAYNFRHFFATVYYYRFHYPSLRALNHFLRQADLDVTRYYIHSRVSGDRLQLQDEARAAKETREALDLQKNFDAVRVGFMKETIGGALTNGNLLAGNGGRALLREVKELVAVARKNVSIASASSEQQLLDDVLTDFVKGRWLEPHPEGFSFCKCGPGAQDLATAVCLISGAKHQEEEAARQGESDPDEPLPWGPSLADAADLHCMICPHGVQLTCNLQEWRRRFEQSEMVARCGPDDTTRAVAASRSALIRDHILRTFGSDAMENTVE